MTEHTFGGSAMDRYVFDLETDPGASPGGGEMGAVAALDAPSELSVGPADIQPAAPDLAAPAVDAPPPAAGWTPEQLDALRDSPEFRDMLAEEAGGVAAQQLQQMLQGYDQQQPRYEGEPIDPSEFLDPANPEFGGNMLNLLAQRDQFILGQMREMFGPVQQRYQNESLQEGQQRIQDVIADDFSRNGEIALPEDSGVKVNDVIKDIAPLYLSEMEQRYGQGTARSAEAAIAKATGLIRNIVTAAEKAGAAKNANHLAALSGAPGEPGTGTGAISVAPATGDEMSVARFHATRGVAV